MKYEIDVHSWSDEPARRFIGELHRDYLLCASCYGPTESDVRAKCLAVQRIDEGRSSSDTYVALSESFMLNQQRRRDRFIAAALMALGSYPKAAVADSFARNVVSLADAVMTEADKAPPPVEDYVQPTLTEQQKRTALAEACRKAASDLQLAALEVHCVMKEEGLFNAVVRNLNELVLSFGDGIE